MQPHGFDSLLSPWPVNGNETSAYTLPRDSRPSPAGQNSGALPTWILGYLIRGSLDLGGIIEATMAGMVKFEGQPPFILPEALVLLTLLTISALGAWALSILESLWRSHHWR